MFRYVAGILLLAVLLALPIRMHAQVISSAPQPAPAIYLFGREYLGDIDVLAIGEELWIDGELIWPPSYGQPEGAEKRPANSGELVASPRMKVVNTLLGMFDCEMSVSERLEKVEAIRAQLDSMDPTMTSIELRGESILITWREGYSLLISPCDKLPTPPPDAKRKTTAEKLAERIADATASRNVYVCVMGKSGGDMRQYSIPPTRPSDQLKAAQELRHAMMAEPSQLEAWYSEENVVPLGVLIKFAENASMQREGGLHAPSKPVYTKEY